MPRPDTFLICKKHLFDDVDQLRDKFPDEIIQKLIRCRAMYLWYLERPFSTDSKFVETDCNQFNISRPTAYADLNIIKAIIPDLSDTARSFHRWRYIEMALETYEVARRKGDTRTMEKAAADYARYTRIDIEEETIDIAEIAPQPFIPTVDPSVLGIKPIPDLAERKKKLLEQLSRETADIRDIDFEEIDIRDLTADPDNDIASKPLKPMPDA